MFEFSRHSQVVWWADAGGADGRNVSFHIRPGSVQELNYQRHQDSSNIAYLDGHAATYGGTPVPNDHDEPGMWLRIDEQ